MERESEMGFFDEFKPQEKPKIKIRQTSEQTILGAIGDQKKLLKGIPVKRNSKEISSWENDGWVTPKVSGLNLFEEGGNKAANNFPTADYSRFLDKLEDGIKSGELKVVISNFDERRSVRDAALASALGKRKK
jgi:hypothetical protein